ncbi:AAA family ATPase [Mesorhizobium sp. NBSH29]|uniref:ATP-dependent DNA helicase n=1 Tax=Mesorhizobium sp. NBSH29 TaxID=2654249 RepID=UPI00189644DA|nr:AAA family ATPase [Mesorhizobium sp. NBSH29]QPC87082.1 AAA family ATPase [Mesorhizobium sp. NBSH29]
MTNWSKQQSDAMSVVGAWLRTKWETSFYLAGYAGTGKTTLAKHIASMQNGEVRFAAFTGKAAKVMRDAGCTNASTIHFLIYTHSTDESTGAVKRHLNKRALDDVALVIIDECSMVDQELGQDLMSFNVPILALGDPGQLPPVSGGGYFTSGPPHYMLTDIHRQAKDSPIIRLATDVREGRWNRNDLVVTDGLTMCRKADLNPAAVTGADAVIVGRNATRNAFNRRMRQVRGFNPTLPPQKGEIVMCLRNDRLLQIYNGESFKISRRNKTEQRIEGRVHYFSIEDPDAPERGKISVRVFDQFFSTPNTAKDIHWKAQRGMQQFDYGYTMTVHKSQGSQWQNVCVFDESSAFGTDWQRHLYTAVTRAANHLTLVVS